MQSVMQSIDRPINQSINQLKNQPINKPVNQSIAFSIDRLLPSAIDEAKISLAYQSFIQTATDKFMSSIT